MTIFYSTGHVTFRFFGAVSLSGMRRGWAEMIRKVYEVDPLICPHCHGQMKVIAFIENHAVIDRIIDHLKLSFQAERPPPPQVVQQELLMAAEDKGNYF